MTRRISPAEGKPAPHWKVRVVLQGALIHLASWDKPRVVDAQPVSHALLEVTADWITDLPGYGDTPLWIDWQAVTAITCRWSG